MEYKYELIGKPIYVIGHKLYRIRALKDFGDVKKGDLGGWIESEFNLSHEGDCWVYDEAKVIDKAQVRQNAKIYNYVQILMRAQICGDAIIKNNVTISGNAYINGSTKILGFALVKDDAFITDNVCINGTVTVSNDVQLRDNVILSGRILIKGSVILRGDVKINILSTNNKIFKISGDFTLTGNVTIKEVSDYIVFKDTWSSGNYFVYTPENKMWTTNNFYGTSDELIKKAYRDSELSGKMYEMYVNMVKSMEKIK